MKYLPIETREHEKIKTKSQKKTEFEKMNKQASKQIKHLKTTEITPFSLHTSLPFPEFKKTKNTEQENQKNIDTYGAMTQQNPTGSFFHT